MAHNQNNFNNDKSEKAYSNGKLGGRSKLFHTKWIICIVQKQNFAVYSMDHKRFVVPLEYLSTNVFNELLKWSQENLGYHPMEYSVVCNDLVLVIKYQFL
ncbi:hypothetical protein Lal_00035115 [Lupinus albus]|nr:hypothetical protein Lal_00035115 [Lupinus albus]